MNQEKEEIYFLRESTNIASMMQKMEDHFITQIIIFWKPLYFLFKTFDRIPGTKSLEITNGNETQVFLLFYL